MGQEHAFATEQDVYEALGVFLADMAGSPGLAPVFRELNSRVTFSMDSPRASITLDCPTDGQASVSTGSAGASGDTVVSLTSDAANSFFLGELNLALALATCQMQVVGPARLRLLVLGPMIRKVMAPLYATRLRGLGREDLLSDWSAPKADRPYFSGMTDRLSDQDLKDG